MGLFDESSKTAVPQDSKNDEPRSIFDSNWSSSSSESDEVQLSKFSIPALLVLIVGILALLTFFYPSFVIAGWIALLGGIAVLITIYHSSVSVTGKGMALTGMSLAITSLIIPTLGQSVYERTKILEAQQVVNRYTTLLSEGKMYDLLQMNKIAPERLAVKDEAAFWKKQMEEERTHLSLHTGFLSNPLMLLLYHLRDQIKYTYIETISIDSPKLGIEDFVLVYAATFTNTQGEKESVLFKIKLTHFSNTVDHEGYWAVSKIPIFLEKADLEALQI